MSVYLPCPILMFAALMSGHHCAISAAAPTPAIIAHTSARNALAILLPTYRNRGATCSHMSCSERMTFSFAMRPPQLGSARTPLRPSVPISSWSRFVTESGVPTITLSRSTSS